MAERLAKVAALADPATELAALEAQADAAPEPDLAEEQLLLGVAQHRARRFLPALLSFEDVEDAAERHHDRLLLMHVCRWQGNNFAMMGDRPRSRDALARAAALAEQLGDLKTQMIAISNLGYLHGEQDEAEPYRAHMERALRLARQLEDPLHISSSLCNLAGALTRLRRFGEATSAIEEGERIALHLGWHIGRARFLAGRGCLLSEMGQFDAAEEPFASAAALFDEQGDYYQLARLAVLRGRYALDASRPQRALLHHAAALELATKWSFDAVPDDVLERQALAFEQLGDLAGSLGALRALLAHRKRRDEFRASESRALEQARSAAAKARRHAEEARRQAASLLGTNEVLREALTREEELRTEVERLARVDPLTGRRATRS